MATDQPAPDDVSRSSQPDHDALAHARDAEVARLDDLTVVGAAEIVVIHAGIAELTAQQQAARRRWATALKLLTEAREGAGAEMIAAAQACADAAYREFQQIAHSNLGEAQRLLNAGLANTAAMLDQVSRTFDAGIAATDTRAQHRPSKPGLVTQDCQIGDGFPAVGEHHCQVHRDPARVMTGLADPQRRSASPKAEVSPVESARSARLRGARRHPGHQRRQRSSDVTR